MLFPLKYVLIRENKVPSSFPVLDSFSLEKKTTVKTIEMWGLILLLLLQLMASVSCKEYQLDCPKLRDTFEDRNYTFRLGGIKLFDVEGTREKALVKKCVAVPEDREDDDDDDRELDYVVIHKEVIPTAKYTLLFFSFWLLKYLTRINSICILFLLLLKAYEASQLVEL